MDCLLVRYLSWFCSPVRSLFSNRCFCVGIKPWIFVQKLGDAIFIPAGCPHQIRNLKVLWDILVSLRWYRFEVATVYMIIRRFWSCTIVPEAVFCTSSEADRTWHQYKNMTTEMAMRKNHWISALSLLIFSILASHSSRDSSFVQFLYVKFL